MLAMKSYFQIGLLTILSAYSAFSDDKKTESYTDCTSETFFPTGPCNEDLYFCQNGKLEHFSCPQTLVFNTRSHFCEDILDVFSDIINNENNYAQQKNRDSSNSISPFPSREGKITGSKTAGLSPLKDIEIQRPLPGQNSVSKSTSQHSTSDIILQYTKEKPGTSKVQQNPPFVETLPHQPSKSSVMGYPSTTSELIIPKPYVSEIKLLKPSTPEDTMTYYMNSGRRFEYVDRPPFDESDYFMYPFASVMIPNKKAKGIVDSFHRYDDKKKKHPQQSNFARINLPISPNHDAFNSKIKQEEKARTGFAPIDSAINGGHDAFRSSRNRRFVDICRPKLLKAKNSIDSAKLQYSQKQSCTISVIPLDCQAFYVACVDGKQVKRHCPSGLFFDASKESCSHRNLISSCLSVPFPINGQQQILPSSAPWWSSSSINPQNAGGQQPWMQEASPSIATLADGEQSKHRQQQTSPSMLAPGINAPVQTGHKTPGQQLTITDLFCDDKPDGFYRHPANCSRILQCFNKELFEYPPCAENLGFDEKQMTCDYKEQIKECNHELTVGGHRSKKDCVHGDHVPNESDCSSFYRCVWNRLMLIKCPKGTVFNNAFHVCDYSKPISDCKKENIDP